MEVPELDTNLSVEDFKDALFNNWLLQRYVARLQETLRGARTPLDAVMDENLEQSPDGVYDVVK